jgi:hypothetical protein
MGSASAFPCAAGILLLGTVPAWAQAPDITELAAEAENPIEPTLKLPVQENLEFGQGPHDRTESLLKLEPVAPIMLAPRWAVVIRTIIPFEYKPDTSAATGGTFGLGDVNPTFFLSPHYGDHLQWGVGPDLELPTAGPSSLGSGKLSLGPSVAVVFKPKHWVFGVIASNIWSIAGDSSKSAVNELSVQYFVHYNLWNGWTLSTSPTMTAEWNAKSGDVWTIPVGAGVGKLFRFTTGAVHFTVQAYDYVATPSDGATWELRLEITFLRADR